MGPFEIILLVLLGLLLTAAVVGGGILGIVAFARSVGLRRELSRIRHKLAAVEARLAAPEVPAAPIQAPPATAEAAPPPAGGPPPVLVPVAVPPPAAAAPSGGLAGFESKIGKRWIAWAGAVVLFFSAAFFLKHAFESDWIGPTGQVIVGALAGLAMLVCGSRFLRKDWRVFGQCLMGLGLAILYATSFAAFSFYEPPILSQTPAFAFMVAITVAGMALAVLHAALPIAFMAVLGGFLTPVLLSTGQDARDALFTYLLLLDLGVLAVALFRGWRLLDALALAGTFVLYAGWYHQFYKPPVLTPALAWLGGFYLVFLALPFVYHLVRRKPFTVERFVMALVNAAVAFGFAWHMLHEDYSFALGFVALGMAAAYLVLGAIVRRRLPEDTPTLFGTIAMTVTFLTMAIPLHLRAHGILLAWVVEGPVLLYLGYRFRYRPVRAFAGAVLLIAVARLFLMEAHWPLHAGLYVPFINRQFLSAILVPAALAGYAVIHHLFRRDGVLLDRVLKLVSALGAGMLALVVLHAEIGGWLENDFSAQTAGCAVTALWALGALAYLAAGVRWRSTASWVWGTGALGLGIALLLGASLFDEGLGRDHVLFANLRFASCLVAVLAPLAYAGAIHRVSAGREGEGKAFAAVFLVAGVVSLLALLTAEVYGYCQDTLLPDVTRANRAGQMSITLVWGLYAACLIFAGFWRRWRPLRLGGLALFGISALKLVLVDLTHLRDVYRIVSFFVLGMLMVGASYLYHRLERLLGSQSVPAPPADEPAGGEQT
ncbi:MAG TPA: DUF2339 domain-containing protein [Phycisphaerae bacterium]|nr:DUF2339 domain-containing protein [Phycisphaerae bacterium]